MNNRKERAERPATTGRRSARHSLRSPSCPPDGHLLHRAFKPPRDPGSASGANLTTFWGQVTGFRPAHSGGISPQSVSRFPVSVRPQLGVCNSDPRWCALRCLRPRAGVRHIQHRCYPRLDGVSFTPPMTRRGQIPDSKSKFLQYTASSENICSQIAMSHGLCFCTFCCAASDPPPALPSLHVHP